MNKNIMPQIIVKQGKDQGKTICILAGVHGNEQCGISAINQLLDDKKFKIDNGKVIFIFANTLAIKNNVRLIDEDLNRCFLKNRNFTFSYEEQLASIIKKYIKNSDICFDIHSSFVKKSKPFIICEKNSVDITKYLPVKKVCFGFDNIEPGGTDYYANLVGKKGICIECGYLNDKNAIQIAKQSILNLLKFTGNIKAKNNEIKKYKQEYLEVNQIYITKTDFRLQEEFNDFQEIKKGQLIGFDGKQNIIAKENGFILFAKNCKKSNEEAFLFGRKINIKYKDRNKIKD